jgi:hypothetical protein
MPAPSVKYCFDEFNSLEFLHEYKLCLYLTHILLANIYSGLDFEVMFCIKMAFLRNTAPGFVL